jgi:heme exporter protein B
MAALHALWALLRREIALAWAGGVATPLGFFLGAATLVPLAVGAERALLERIGPPLLLVFAGLAAIMTFERLLQADLEDGSIDQWALAPWPMEVFAAVKAIAAVIAIGGPITLTAAPLAIALQTPPAAAPVVVLAVGLALAAFYGFGLLGAALTAGVKRGGLLLALLVLPFMTPPLLFAAAAISAAAAGQSSVPPLTLLSACVLFAWTLGPFGAGAALRAHSES